MILKGRNKKDISILPNSANSTKRLNLSMITLNEIDYSFT